MSIDVTQRITEFVLGSSLEAIPPEAVRQAKIAVIDSLGVALAGSHDEAAHIAAAFAREQGGGAESTIIGRGAKTSASMAAFANGIALHALDFDFSFGGLGQPTAPILPAVLALAEARGATGADLLLAYLTGFEVTGKLGACLHPNAGEKWHAPGTVGAVGAAAGAAKVLGLDATQLPMAMGIIASLAGGVTANFGTMSKPLHVAAAARDGVTAAKLAAAGFTANPGALQSAKGFLGLFFGEPPHIERIEELGSSYAIVDEGLRLKPYPCGGLTHPSIEAAMQLRAEHALPPEAIESVDVLVRQHVFNTIAFKVPRNETEGKFCMPYLIARTMIDGAITLDTFTDEAIADAAVLDLASRVEMRTDGAADRPSDVTIRLRNGESLSASVNFARGGRQLPLSDAKVEAKFMDCASRVLGEAQARDVLGQLQSIEALTDVRQLCALLAPRA